MYRKYGVRKIFALVKTLQKSRSYNTNKELMESDSNKTSFEKRGGGRGGGTKVDNEFKPFSPAR